MMMCRLISVVAIIYVLSTVRFASGYKWIALKSGDPIPEKAIRINYSGFVGRLNYYNIILPAEVTIKGAAAYIGSKIIEKNEFEILVRTENDFCLFRSDAKIENLVRAGTAWDGEPIYVGQTVYSDDSLTSIYLTLKIIDSRSGRVQEGSELICNDKNEWVDASSENFPNNTIKNGDAAVARILGPSTFVAGEVEPNGLAWAEYKGHQLTSSHYQVLVGDSNAYSWKATSDGRIPDYAVVTGKTTDNELIYVMRVNGYVKNLVFSELSNKRVKYEVLVKNVENM